MKAALITRQFPQAEMPFLRVHIGRVEQRPERKPDGTAAGDTVQVFRLLGFGQTESAAQAMARVTLARSRT